MDPDPTFRDTPADRTLAFARARGFAACRSTAGRGLSAPDAVKPNWCALADPMPTWNDVAAHLRGSLSTLSDICLCEVLDLLSADFEARLGPKPACSASKCLRTRWIA